MSGRKDPGELLQVQTTTGFPFPARQFGQGRGGWKAEIAANCRFDEKSLPSAESDFAGRINFLFLAPVKKACFQEETRNTVLTNSRQVVQSARLLGFF